MSAIVRAALLIVCVALHAGAQSRSLALYAGEANGLTSSALHSAQRELDLLLAPAGIDLSWRDLESRKPGEQFDQVVVMTFEGSCAEPATAPHMPQDVPVSLADSSVSKGRVLPFVRVDCGYLAQMLAPTLRTMNSKERNKAFGRALGRVVAHEIYHIMGETTEHQDRGVAKASFSVRDLTAEDFSFDVVSLTQMRPTPSLSSFAGSSDEVLER